MSAHFFGHSAVMWADRAEASRQRRQLIEWKLDDARYQVDGAQSDNELKRANELLHEVLEMLKDKTERMLREDHDACWRGWVEIKESLKWRRKEICDFNYGHFKNEAYQAKGWAEDLPKDAKRKVQEVQRAMKGRTMERWQYDEINEVLDEAWRTAAGALGRRQAEWEQRRAEMQQKMREAKARKVAAIEYRREKIYNHERQVDKCRDMLSNVRSDDFRRRVEEWIDEHYAKIRELEYQIQDLQRAVDDIDHKLD